MRARITNSPVKHGYGNGGRIRSQSKFSRKIPADCFFIEANAVYIGNCSISFFKCLELNPGGIETVYIFRQINAIQPRFQVIMIPAGKIYRYPFTRQ